MIEKCIRCGRPTPYDIQTPIAICLYYIDGSGQFCEDCWKRVYGEIKTITLPTPTIPTPADQERYNQLINKPTLTDADREELARLHKKYTEGCVRGPKALGVPRAGSYLYSIFLRFGVIARESKGAASAEHRGIISLVALPIRNGGSQIPDRWLKQPRSIHTLLWY